jgi:hypothetical protein
VRAERETLKSIAERAFPWPDHAHFLLRRAVEELTAAVKSQRAGETALASSLQTFWGEAKNLPAQDWPTRTEENLGTAEKYLTVAAKKCQAARGDLCGARFERFLLLMDALSESRSGGP